ncbi:MAG: F0F1 ATP synthase subunit B, partial [Acidobacteria bacterium]|nr:F0F1 ATP synthase subunit B [Acidobacteriota bacterium]
MGERLITPDVGTILWTIITFVILAFLLRKFAWGPLMATLEERERTIRESLDAAQKARAEAEEAARRHQETLARARREVAALIEQGKRVSEIVRAGILAQSRMEALDLVEQGKK